MINIHHLSLLLYLQFIVICFRSFRRKILYALQADLGAELNFIRQVTAETPKNYQLWQHRQLILQRLSAPEVAEADLEETKGVLLEDAKNIHCWQYRQWLIDFFQLNRDKELCFVDELLAEDVYNNSAWNHRAFLLRNNNSINNNNSECLDWCFSKLTKETADNECFWNYLASLLKGKDQRYSDIFDRLQSILGPLDDSENWLFWRFVLIFSNNQKQTQEACQKLMHLRPLNHHLWSMMLNQN